MTTWTPKTQQAETWSESPTGLLVFSPFVFSNASFGGKYVFAFRNTSAGVEGWHRSASSAESWVNA